MMGMQSIELVMDVEDEFGIRIPDDAAEQCITVGQLHTLVVNLIRSGSRQDLKKHVDLESLVWMRLCELSAKLSRATRPADIKPETRFVDDLGYG